MDELSVAVPRTGKWVEQQSHLEKVQLIKVTLGTLLGVMKSFCNNLSSSQGALWLGIYWEVLHWLIYLQLCQELLCIIHMIAIETIAIGFGNWFILDWGVQFCY